MKGGVYRANLPSLQPCEVSAQALLLGRLPVMSQVLQAAETPKTQAQSLTLNPVSLDRSNKTSEIKGLNGDG